MAAPAQQTRVPRWAQKPTPIPAEERQPLVFRRLLPAGDPATADEIVEGLELQDRVGASVARPYVMLNMISTADGRASIGGRSGPIGNRADRELFHGLRAAVDAVMAGAGTVRVERYGRIVRDERRRRLRRERGLSEEPLACIVSGRLSLPPETPLLADPSARVVIVTPSQASLPESAAHVDYVRARRDGLLDLPAALAELRERFAVRTLLCEGGPHLNSQLLVAGLVDELFLSLSPKLAGGEDATGEALRIIAGAELEQPVELELLGALESDSQLFLRYGVCASAPSASRGRRCSTARSPGDALPAATRGVAAMRTTTSSPSSSSSVMRGTSRRGVCSDFSSSSCRSLGVMPGRRRARRFTASGSRSGSTAPFSTTLLGTMIESSPLANVV